jgi:hypothetical protein
VPSALMSQIAEAFKALTNREAKGKILLRP